MHKKKKTHYINNWKIRQIREFDRGECGNDVKFTMIDVFKVRRRIGRREKFEKRKCNTYVEYHRDQELD